MCLSAVDTRDFDAYKLRTSAQTGVRYRPGTLPPVRWPLRVLDTPQVQAYLPFEEKGPLKILLHAGMFMVALHATKRANDARYFWRRVPSDQAP